MKVGFVLRGCLVAGLAVGCLDVDTPFAPRRASVRDLPGAWVFHIDGGRFRDHVQVLAIDTTNDSEWPLRMAPLVAKDWAGASNEDLACAVCVGRVSAGWAEWKLSLMDGDSAVLNYGLKGDTAVGSLMVFHGGIDSTGPYSVIGVRFDSALLASPVLLAAVRRVPGDSTPIILMQIADIPTTDRDFVQRLITRGLYGEIGVITSFVGTQGRPAWDDIKTWTYAGMEVSAHSRVHSGDTGTPLEFLAEVVGSLEDLSQHGLATRVFLQPGSWHDSLFFDSRVKLANWRGALLRTFTSVFGAYVYPASETAGVGDSVALGLGHITISDGATPQAILRVWKYAVRPNSFTVLLVHSLRLPTPDTLDWFLDTLAIARASGRIRLAHSATELLGQ